MKEDNTYNEHVGANLPNDLRMNPFRVPTDYFDELENAVLARVTAQKLKDRLPADTGFGVPDGYFGALHQKIQSKLFVERLRNQNSDDGFSVPDNYFEDSQSAIRAALAESKLRDEVSQDGQSVPDGFFDKLSEQITATVHLDHVAPALASSFTVPDNYFESLSAEIMARVKLDTLSSDDNDETPVVKMPSRTNWSQYAAAAVVALMVSVGSYFALDLSGKAQEEAHTELALEELSNEEIFNYLTQVTDGVELMELVTLLPENGSEKTYEVDGQVEDQEIEEYLNYML